MIFYIENIDGSIYESSSTAKVNYGKVYFKNELTPGLGFTYDFNVEEHVREIIVNFVFERTSAEKEIK